MGELGSMIGDDLSVYQMQSGYAGTNCMQQISLTSSGNVMDTYNAQGTHYFVNQSSNNGFYGTTPGPPNFQPNLRILEQPFSRHRFRYQSERGSHGGMFGESTTNPATKKTYPTVKLENFDPSKKVMVRASLYTDTDPPLPHVHRLQGKFCDPISGQCHLPLGEDNVCCFQGLGISFTAKKEVKDILYKRLLEGNQMEPLFDDLQLKEEAEKVSKIMQAQMNTVIICFEALYEGGDNHPFAKTFSRPVNNQRELKITRLSKCSGYCQGSDEVFLLCEKVNKKEIKVRFYEVDDSGNICWSDFAQFSDSDVHHQVAIVFRTPPYRDCNIDKPVTVQLQLLREKDNETSEPKEFTYKPNRTDPEHIDRKRKRIDESYGSDPSNSSQGGNGGNYDPRSFNPGGNVGGAYDTGAFHHYIHPGQGSSSTRRSSGSLTSEENSLNEIFDTNISPNALIHHGQQFNEMDFLTPLSPTSNTNVDGASTTKRPLPNDVSVLLNSLSLEDQPVPIKESESSIAATAMSKKAESTLSVSRIVEVLGRAVQVFATTADPKSFLYPMRQLLAKPDQNGDNALHLAIIHQSENKELFQQLLRVVNTVSLSPELQAINSTNNNYQTPLHLAVAMEKSSLVSLLLLNNADPAIQDNKGHTAIHLSIIKKSQEILEILLNKQSYGCRQLAWDFLNLRNYKGYTALHLAVELNLETFVTRLVDAGAGLNVGDGLSGKTPLHLAVESYPEIVPCLLKQMKIDVDQQDYAGNTALHYACMQKDRDLVLQLMQVEANPLKENFSFNCQTPFSIAQGDSEIQEILSGQISPGLRWKISESRRLSANDLQKVSDSKLVSENFKPIEVEEKLQPMDSGYDSGQVEKIPEELLTKVCAILDPPQVGWEKLCEILISKSQIGSIRTLAGKSPTRYLISKMDKATIDEVKHALDAAGLTEAIQVIDEQQDLIV